MNCRFNILFSVIYNRKGFCNRPPIVDAYTQLRSQRDPKKTIFYKMSNFLHVSLPDLKVYKVTHNIFDCTTYILYVFDCGRQVVIKIKDLSHEVKDVTIT